MVALKGQMNELTGHKLKRVKRNAPHASDLTLYILTKSVGLFFDTQDFLKRLTRIKGLLEKRDRLYSPVRADREAAIAILTKRSRFSLGDLLVTRQKLLNQMDRALQELKRPFRLAEALVESD